MFDVFICSPLRAENEVGVFLNIRLAESYCRFAANKGFDPFAPHIFYTRFLNEFDEKDRRKGIEWGKKKLSYCREIWVFAKSYFDSTSGMKEEILEAISLGLTVRYFDPITLVEYK